MPVIQTRQPGGASEAKQDAIIAALDSVGLDAATLAALETVTATISNFPADYPDFAAALLLTAVKNAVEGTLDVNVISSATSAVSGTVALDAATLAALETVNAVVSGEVELGATTLAALESVTATVSNFPSDYPDSAAAGLLTEIRDVLSGTLTVALDAATLAALENVTATIANLPPDYPDSAAATLLTAIRDAVQGTLDVNVISSSTTAVSGTVGLDAPTLAALETINAVVSGSVELGATTLAALESVTATVSNFPTDYPDAAATALLTTISNSLQGTLSVSVTNFPSVYPDGHIQPLTKTQLDSSTVAVSGSLNVNNFPASTEISNDSGNPIPVTGTVSVNEPVTVDGVQLDGLTDAEIRASALNVADSGEREYTHVTADVTASGNTTIYTPSLGSSIRLRWIFITPSLESDPFPKITVKLGTDELYKFYGSMAKRQLKTGTIDSPLIINLSVSGNVAVTAILEEV